MNEIQKLVEAQQQAVTELRQFHQRMDKFIEGIQVELQKQGNDLDENPRVRIIAGEKSFRRTLTLEIPAGMGQSRSELFLTQKSQGIYEIHFRNGDTEEVQHPVIAAHKIMDWSANSLIKFAQIIKSGDPSQAQN